MDNNYLRESLIEEIAITDGAFLRILEVTDGSEVILHHEGFRTEDEMTLLGQMVKLACMEGKNVHVISHA